LDHIAIYLVLLVGRRASKSPRLRRFKSDQDEIWQDCSLSKYASIDGVGLVIGRHAFQMAAMTSFRLVNTVSFIFGSWLLSEKIYRLPEK